MSDSTETFAPEDSETLQQLQQVRSGESAPVEAAGDVADGQPAGEVVAEAKVKIGDKEFASQEEAFQYAESLQAQGETERLISDAYRQGIQDAIQKDPIGQNVTQPAEPAMPSNEELDAQFFENPTEYLRKHAEQVRQEAEQAALEKIRAEQAEENLWQEFFSRHPDLDGFRQDATMVLESNRQLVEDIARTQGKQKALDYLAQKTRAKFQAWAERSRPQQELQRNAATPTPSGSERVTQSSTTEEAVDFASQLRNHNRAKQVR